MEHFEAKLAAVYTGVERYVKFRLDGGSDAEDILQDICLTAYLKYDQLQNKNAFKPWILSIAKNRCADYLRKRRSGREVPLEEIPEGKLVYGRRGWVVSSPVEETLDALTERDREVLRLFYWQQLSLQGISRKLDIPVGTVKSRLNTAREHFKKQYPYPPKEETIMTKLPKIMPKYSIEKLDMEPFAVKWEEMQGWLIVPKLGEKLQWAMYDHPERTMTSWCDMAVVGKAEIHGIEGVEITATQYGAGDDRDPGFEDGMERRLVAQLTDTHSRYLAQSHTENGVRKVFTFLDGEAFENNWGFGPDNCGNETNLASKGLLTREGNVITGYTPQEVVDVVGRYRVTIHGKSYDTVCVMDIQCFNDDVASEQYVDQNGRTVLWRRFNRDDWEMERFGGQLWSEKLPENQRLTINGETYVHWYDCISNYIL